MQIKRFISVIAILFLFPALYSALAQDKTAITAEWIFSDEGLAADDVAQETLLKAANRIHQYEPHSNLRAWVYRIGVNEARGYLRRQKARQRMQRWFKHEAEVDTAVSPSPEAQTIQNERDAALWQAVSQLPEKHRLPILLRYSHNLATPEIAEILQLSPGTVRSRLHYAHQKLHHLLSMTG